MDILNRINNNLYSFDEKRDMEIVLEMAMLIDNECVINEAFDVSKFKSGVKGLMKSIGIGTHKTGDGLIQVALKSGKLMAEFIWNILKAAGGDKDAVTRVKEIANTEIKKEEFLDFLLKLDMATLHLVSGPLHLVDALTGWHIWAHIKGKTEDAMEKAKNAIKNLVDAAKEADESVRKKLKSLMHGIARLFGLDQEQQLIKQV